MAAGPIKLGNDVGDSFAYARNFSEPVLLDQPVEGDRKRCETVCSAGVGLGTVGVAASQRCALRVLAQQLCYLRGISDRHSPASLRPQAASRRPADATLCSEPILNRATSPAFVQPENRPCDAGSGHTPPPSSGGDRPCL